MRLAESIIEGLAVPVISVDVNLRILAINSLAINAFSEADEAFDFDLFLDRVSGLRPLLENTIETAEPAKLKIKPKAGFRSDYSITVKNIGALEGAASPVLVLTFEDRSLFNDLKAMRIGFVANVSHEIRSPLTAISGFVETLQGPAIEDVAVRERFLGMMAKEVTRMTNLVSDLLSLSQVEAKERYILKNRIDLRSVIDQAVQSVGPVAQKWGKTLEMEIGADLPSVMGRQDDLVRVLINLLENAIHYSAPNGKVRLVARANCGVNPLDRDAIEISVTDDGEGIAPDEIPRLTQRFYRVDKSRSRNMGGTGLGLAIVKHILVRHRGELSIESVVGQGATCTIYLPSAAQETPDLS
ncbi:MAG: ATP-binding protein [Rhodobacterales bacterium]|nr:ATP-binding protein [Rhodobacterales bacterium]